MFILLEHQHIRIGKNLHIDNPGLLFFVSRSVSNPNLSIEEIFKSRLDESMNKTSSSLLRGEAFNLHLRGWSYDSSKTIFLELSSINRFLFKACLQDRRGVKYNVSFDLSASCIENFVLHSSNISRTMKLGRIDSVPSNGTSSINNDDDDESSKISFHVSTKYTYTLTFSSTITTNRGKYFVFRFFCL
jgi:hypothetical protein